MPGKCRKKTLMDKFIELVIKFRNDDIPIESLRTEFTASQMEVIPDKLKEYNWQFPGSLAEIDADSIEGKPFVFYKLIKKNRAPNYVLIALDKRGSKYISSWMGVWYKPDNYDRKLITYLRSLLN